MSNWPQIPYERWKNTGASLHMWLQIVGKFRLSLTPWINHSWQATFYVTSRGLTTSLIPGSSNSYCIEFDFIDQKLKANAVSGAVESFDLHAMSVADFHRRFLDTLRCIEAPTSFHGSPNETDDATPFAARTSPGEYDSAAATDFWRALVSVSHVFSQFRTGFLGKASPVHLFWGSLDLAVTRFSGREAPLHPGGIPNLPDAVTREAYSHEVSSAGFWPGGGGVDYPAFYSYAYPTPDHFKTYTVSTDGAFFDDALGEFILPYDAVREASNPEAKLLDFLVQTYEAAAVSGKWSRGPLECELGRPSIPRAVP